MDQSVEAWLSFPPSANRMYRNINGSRTLMSRVYRSWKAENCANLFTSNGFVHPQTVSVSMILVPPDKRKRDLDNYIKPVLDVLEGCRLLENDSMVKRLSVAWSASNKASSGVSCVIQLIADPALSSP